MLSEFAKVFERKVWRVQGAHLHNAARALSSLSRCFQLSTNLDKVFFRYHWYCGKKQIERLLVWHWWNSTDLGLIELTYFFTNQNAGIVACIFLFRKSRHKPNLKSTWVFPDLGEKWRRSEHAHASCPGLSFHPHGFSPYLGLEERRVQWLDYKPHKSNCNLKKKFTMLWRCVLISS